MNAGAEAGITGKRVRLRAIRRADLETLRGYVNDPDVMQHSNQYWPVSEAGQEEWFEGLAQARDRVWFALDDLQRGEPKLAGTCCLVGIDWVSRLAELRIRIGDKSVWGSGLGTEATQLLIQYAFIDLNLERVWLRVFETNPRAIRMYEKVGFAHEGRLRRASFIQGKMVDVLLMAVLKSEWSPRRVQGFRGMRVAIHQPQYLPYPGFFHKLAHCDLFIALDNVQFQKNGVQNRNKIKTADGWQWLTVPVRHDFGQNIRQVRINTEIPWARKNWNALVTSYKRAPFFDAYAPGLEAIYTRDEDSLCEVNCLTTEWAMQTLEIGTPIQFASEIEANGAQTELLVNLCRAVGATTYLSGPGGKRYMDLELFARAGIEVEFQEFQSPTYEQVFPQAGFVPDLSIVDALFCCGPSAKEFVH